VFCYVTDMDSLCLYSEEVNKVSGELESGRPMSCWDVREVENIKSTEQI